MATRKKHNLILEQKQAVEKLEEVNNLLQQSIDEEKNLIETVEKEITDIAEKNGFFAGVVLTHNDIVSILQIALKTGENVQVPFKLTFKE